MKRSMTAAIAMALAIVLILSATFVVFASSGNISVNGSIRDSSASEDVTYHITYDANGGTGSFTGQEITDGSIDTVLSVEETGIIWEGHTFTNWNTASDGTGTSCESGDSITLNSDVTLYAQWKEVSQSNGGTRTEKPSGGTDGSGGTTDGSGGATDTSGGGTDASGGTATGEADTGTPSAETIARSLVPTGDVSNIALWLSLLGISIGAMVFLLRRHRRNKPDVKEIK